MSWLLSLSYSSAWIYVSLFSPLSLPCLSWTKTYENANIGIGRLDQEKKGLTVERYQKKRVCEPAIILIPAWKYSSETLEIDSQVYGEGEVE